MRKPEDKYSFKMLRVRTSHDDDEKEGHDSDNHEEEDEGVGR